MNCCINCFKDSEIRSIISSYNNISNCDFCGSLHIPTYHVGCEPNPIADGLVAIINIYGVAADAGAKPLKNALYDDWDIFAIGSEAILLLVKKLCSFAYPEDSEIFSRNVAITRLANRDFLQQVAIVGGKTWQEFSEHIKLKNRFHANMFNAEMFGAYLENAEKEYVEGTVMYRARIAPNKQGFAIGEMGAPPTNRCISGRVNPEGIGVLYLSLDNETVLHETKASTLDFVSVGEFRLNRNARIVNLTEISQISPFLFIEDLEQYAANRKVFQEIALEIAKPLRRNDSSLEYLPTQYITEFIKSRGYDGVEYASTLKNGGYNLAIFDEKLFTCTKVRTVEVSDVTYVTKPNLGSESSNPK